MENIRDMKRTRGVRALLTEEEKQKADIQALSYDYACRIVRLFQYLTEESETKEFVMSKQIYRSGTSIGANVREANHAQSDADFLNKMNIALKEADETDYAYAGNEECLGRILEKNNMRDKVKIATKLPQYLVKNKNQIDKFFDEELKRLRTDHVDYYLMHMFTDIKNWDNLKSLGIVEWIEENMVRNVNATQVAPEERLSDHVYIYDAKEHELFRADRENEHFQVKENAAVQSFDKQAGKRTSIKEKLAEKKSEVEAREAKVSARSASKAMEACI